MKRSKSVVLTSIMAGTGLTVAACDDGGASRPNTQLSDPPAATASAGEAATEVRQYASLEECKAAGVYAPAFCDQSFAAAQADHAQNAPKFNDQQSCEERYGVDQCVPRNQAGGGSFFTPLLTGFIVGQALGNLGGRAMAGGRCIAIVTAPTASATAAATTASRPTAGTAVSGPSAAAASTLQPPRPRRAPRAAAQWSPAAASAAAADAASAAKPLDSARALRLDGGRRSAMPITDYSEHDGLGLAELVRRGEVSPAELAEAAIERIERHGQLNAVVYKAYDQARSTAAGGLPDGRSRACRSSSRTLGLRSPACPAPAVAASPPPILTRATASWSDATGRLGWCWSAKPIRRSSASRASPSRSGWALPKSLEHRPHHRAAHRAARLRPWRRGSCPWRTPATG
jgi:uncharacterized protein YgiB involved in biofilm formation